MERIKKAMEKARAGATSWPGLQEVGAVPTHTLPETSGASIVRAKSIPMDPASLERHRIIAGNKDDPRATCFDILRTKVLQAMRKDGFRTLAITSPMPECGKTTIAVNLALSVSQLADHRTLLADLDLRRPKIDQYLGLHPDRDLSDYLEGQAPLEEVLIDPGMPGLVVLTNAKAYRNAAEMLTGPKIRSLVGILAAGDTASVSIFDLPPMLPTDDTIAFLPQVDCVLLVVEDGSTKKPELQETLRLLGNATLLGVVLNKSGAFAPTYY